MKQVAGIFGFLWKVYVGVIFMMLALFFYPIIFPFLYSDKNRKRAFKIFVIWSWVFRIFGGYFVKRVKTSELPKGPYLVVANHASYLDIFLMFSLLPRSPFLFLGKSEILKYPIIKAYFRRMNIPVFRDNKLKAAKSIVQSINSAKNGWSIVIFPEGGIPDDNNPKMIPFKNGAFQIAKAAKLPIVPISFTNNYKLFSDPSFILGPARPGISNVYIHDYISSEEVAKSDLETLNKKCFKIINEPILKTHPDLAQ